MVCGMVEGGGFDFGGRLGEIIGRPDPTAVDLLGVARACGLPAAGLVTEAMLGAGDHAHDVEAEHSAE